MQQLIKPKHFWKKGLAVKVEEYLDGERLTFSVVRDGGLDWKFIAEDRPDLLDDNIMALLNVLAEDHGESTLHYILVGAAHCKINDYGRDEDLVLVDIECEGKYLDADLFDTYSAIGQFETPPEFFRGRYELCIPNQFKHGSSAMSHPATIRTYFKERLGIVIKPLFEQELDDDEGRLVGVVLNPKYESYHE